jgi:hypothetical protein
MSHNTFGHLFRVTTWGESHGPALGAVVDGCAAGHCVSEADAPALARPARPGQKQATPPSGAKPDAVKILSGVFEGETTGTPVQLMIENTDQRSKDYSEIAEKLPPGPCRHHLLAEIRHPRSARRRARLGARDGRAGGRRGRGARGAGCAGPGPVDYRLHGADGPASDRPRRASTGTRSTATRSGCPTPGPPRTGPTISTGCANRAIPWVR